MGEIIKKATFEYVKKDGEKSERTVLSPKFVKESYNSIKDFEKESVNYISGYEIDKEGLTEEEVEKYEKSVIDYFSIVHPTLEDYISDLKLDPKKVQRKTFKKNGVENLNLIKETKEEEGEKV